MHDVAAQLNRMYNAEPNKSCALDLLAIRFPNERLLRTWEFREAGREKHKH
jgi:hypothetical protein